MGALGTVVVYTLVLMLFDRLLPAIVAAATLGLAGVWWGNAAVATPYNAVPVAIGCLLVILLIWNRNGNARAVYAGFLILGVAFGYHPTIMFFIPVFIAGIFVLGPWRSLIKLKPILISVLMVSIGLSTYLYLPIRSADEPEVMYQKVDSVSKLYRYVTAGDARDSAHKEPSLPGISEISDRMREVVRNSYFPSYSVLIFAPAIVLLYPAVWPVLRKRRRYLIFLAGAALVHMMIVFILSNVYAQYYMPLLLYLSIWAGFSVYLIIVMSESYISNEKLKYLPVAITGAVYFIVLALGLPQTWEFANHNHDTGMGDYVEYVFEKTPENSVVLANWESYTGMLYAQIIEGLRPDLTIFPVQVEEIDTAVSDAELRDPSANIMVSRSFYIENESEIREFGRDHPLSLKGRTYQDFDHGKPYPVAAQLFDAR